MTKNSTKKQGSKQNKSYQPKSVDGSKVDVFALPRLGLRQDNKRELDVYASILILYTKGKPQDEFLIHRKVDALGNKSENKELVLSTKEMAQTTENLLQLIKSTKEEIRVRSNEYINPILAEQQLLTVKDNDYYYAHDLSKTRDEILKPFREKYKDALNDWKTNPQFQVEIEKKIDPNKKPKSHKENQEKKKPDVPKKEYGPDPKKKPILPNYMEDGNSKSAESKIHKFISNEDETNQFQTSMD